MSSMSSLSEANRGVALIHGSPDNARRFVDVALEQVREVRSVKSSKSPSSLAESLLWRGDSGAGGAGAGARSTEALRSTEEEELGSREAAMAFLQGLQVSPFLGSRKANTVLKCVYKCSGCFSRVIPKLAGDGELLCMYDPSNNRRYFDFSIGQCPECRSELEYD